jgi:hypothetical protein
MAMSCTTRPCRPTLGSPTHHRVLVATERGTAIFVVVLVLTTLTGIGLFAARMTSSVDTATGYARQSLQAQGLSIYAGQLAANVLVDQAAIIKNAMESSAATGTGASCPSNRGQANAYCAYRTNSELSNLTQAAAATLLVAQGQDQHGSLGPMHGLSTVGGVEGTMQIEFLDVARAIPKAGASMGSSTQSTETPYEFGLNAWAQIRPAINANSPNWCLSDAASTSSNVQAARLYITVPRL